MEQEAGRRTDEINRFDGIGPERRENTGGKSGGKFVRGFLTGIVTALILFGAGLGAAHIYRGLGSGDFASDTTSKADVERKLDQLNGIIENYYLYEDEIDEDALIDGIYSGYASALGDPYTEYYGEEETKALFETTSGEFTGIGATMSKNVNSGKITIVNVYKDSPADKAGLEEGDILTGVDGESTAGQELDTVVSKVKGEKGTEVVLTISRDGEEMDLTAVRDIIEVQTVDYEMKEGRIGYIYVSEFDNVTYEQFKDALEDLEEQGMEGLVIDLRSNPGGVVSAVTDMLKLLLPEGTIVSTKDKYGNEEKITCDGDNEFTKPLAVLVNQYSASASEIFSAAVQDYGIGQIVGVTTYGKGVVQQIISMDDGTSMKVTIAEYYTPSGRSINGEGVTPDVEVEYKYNTEDPEADNQLDAALETIRQELGS